MSRAFVKEGDGAVSGSAIDRFYQGVLGLQPERLDDFRAAKLAATRRLRATGIDPCRVGMWGTRQPGARA